MEIAGILRRTKDIIDGLIRLFPGEPGRKMK